jgi:hypothetical protein
MNYYNYFTEIEEHFVRRRGKHLLISPMDWGLISAWRDAGVPLQVALRGIDIAMDTFFAQPRKNAKVNSLCYCHDSVMTEYANHLESHVGEASEPAAPAPAAGDTSGKQDSIGASAALEYIRERIGEIKTLLAKQYPRNAAESASRVPARLEEVCRTLETASHLDSEKIERDLAIIDDLLVAELRSFVSAEQMLEWEKDAKKDLKVYRKRLPKETYEKIHGNYVRDRIHKNFKVGELSIFHL